MRMRPRLPGLDRVAGYPNPFEAYLLAASCLQGIALAAGYTASPAVTAALESHGWLKWVWASLLGAGGFLALLGLYWPGDPFTSVEIKRVGLVAAGFGALVYGAALVLLPDGRGLLAGGYAVALTAACFVRTWQVTKLLKQAEAAVAVQREAT